MKTTKTKIVIFALLSLIVLSWIILAIMPRTQASEDNLFVLSTGDRPLLIAHGGGNREFPDNTLEACYNAFHADSDVMLELDVSITKDGVVILSHDTTLDYRTNASGKISDWSYIDLLENQVDFSYLNELQDGKISEVIKYTDYKGVQVTPEDVIYPEGISPRDEYIFLVTTLDEMLSAFPNNLINIEIKQQGAIGQAALTEVLRLIEEYDAFDRVVLASFHKDIYESILLSKRTLYSRLMCSPEAEGVAKILISGWFGLDIFYNEPVTVLQVPMNQSVISLDTRHFINTAHRHNIAVHYWTIDSEEDMLHLIKIGADGIMTNLPHLLKQVYDNIYGKDS